MFKVAVNVHLRGNEKIHYSFIYRLSLRASCVLGTLLKETAISRDLRVGLGRERVATEGQS